MADLLERLVLLEQDICYQELPSETQPEYRFVSGARLPVLISAPHGAVHIRAGIPKPEDEYTAAMALLLGELTGAHVLYARRRSATDPNADFDAPYKGELSRLAREHAIRFVLDLHGAHLNRHFGLALGTMKGRSCPEQLDFILAKLEEYGFLHPPRPGMDELQAINLDGRFAALGEDGRIPITRYVCETLGIPAAQVEINAHLRIARRKPDASEQSDFPVNYPEKIENTVRALAAVVEAVASL